mgnify:CR=1 FL=1
MFVPLETWNVFQDRQLMFSRLLRVQRALGKENMPLIPQIYCQTHQDLMNLIGSSSVTLPCLVRTGPLGKGKIKIDNLQMLKDFASILSTTGQSCTIEQFLDAKCDLIVQKLGTSLKLFKRNVQFLHVGGAKLVDRTKFGCSGAIESRHDQQFARTSSRQSSIGAGVFSSLMQATSQQQSARNNPQTSSPGNMYERMSEVNNRYRSWAEAIVLEFENKIETFCLKIVVANDDREYIVGLSDCATEFLGSVENQEEDRRSFVELVISHMNTDLPKMNLSREPSLSATSGPFSRRESGDDKAPATGASFCDSPQRDKRKFVAQASDGAKTTNHTGPLNNRSQSVSANQSDFLAHEQTANRPPSFARRGSDRVNGTTDSSCDTTWSSQELPNSYSSTRPGGSHQRQASVGQSLLDQTSTALSSLQKQSLNFFRRLDSRADESENTPPLSAKSDWTFERDSTASKGDGSDKSPSSSTSNQEAQSGFKLQPIEGSVGGSRKRESPPKPPPPQTVGNRQSSWASNSGQRASSSLSSTPTSTPSRRRQNSASTDSDALDSPTHRGKVLRQNSALSAFEPYDMDLASRAGVTTTDGIDRQTTVNSQQVIADGGQNKVSKLTRRSMNSDSGSMTSGDSNSTGETINAEDTMNNLKKTFASIFGEKCD